MRRILTASLAAHWASFFAVRAFGEAALGGPVLPPAAMVPAWQAAAVGSAFLLAAMMFGWLLVASLVAASRPDQAGADIAATAYATAVAVLTGFSLLGHLDALPAVPTPEPLHVAMLVAGLAVSFLACAWEARPAPRPEVNPVRGALRLMAAGAAHSSMLDGLAGRPNPGPRGQG